MASDNHRSRTRHWKKIGNPPVVEMTTGVALEFCIEYVDTNSCRRRPSPGVQFLEAPHIIDGVRGAHETLCVKIKH
jgi:hypothetical protein